MTSPQPSAPFVDPDKAFAGTVVITVPHMDDEVLACGGTLARLPQKKRIYLIYATDGSRSPAPPISRIDSVSSDLSMMRMRESRAALKLLGIPDGNLHFLGFPEGRLKSNVRDYSESLFDLLRQLKPDHVLTPFRFDRHPDHLAVNRATTQALQCGVIRAALWEFFVYYRWRLLPAGDVRKYIRSDQLIRVNIQNQAEIKRRALDCFNSQTTVLYRWQERPILPQSSLEEVCRNPEFFLRYNPLLPGAGIFVRARLWIRFAHLVETPLKTKKDRLRALAHRYRPALGLEPGKGGIGWPHNEKDR